MDTKTSTTSSKMNSPARTSAILILGLLFWGWGASVAFSASETTSNATAKSYNNPPKVSLIDAQVFVVIRKQLKGKVVVVNLWATWCDPCRQEFPELVRLYDAYQAKGLEMVALSRDDPQNIEEVQDFARKRHARFPVFIVDPKGANQLLELLSPHWTGVLPSTFIFDRAGILKAQIFGAIKPREFENTIKPLL
jgi:thiol-disulfide isomerase/thioredoxin